MYGAPVRERVQLVQICTISLGVMGVISIVIGIINQLITGGAPPWGICLAINEYIQYAYISPMYHVSISSKMYRGCGWCSMNFHFGWVLRDSSDLRRCSSCLNEHKFGDCHGGWCPWVPRNHEYSHHEWKLMDYHYQWDHKNTIHGIITIMTLYKSPWSVITKTMS